MRANIYIRKENEEFWASLEDKSKFVNHLLQVEQMEKESIPPIMDEVAPDPDPEKVEQLFNRMPLERACCVNKRKRCQHWQWDDDQAQWTNTLSGRQLEE